MLHHSARPLVSFWCSDLHPQDILQTLPVTQTGKPLHLELARPATATAHPHCLPPCEPKLYSIFALSLKENQVPKVLLFLQRSSWSSCVCYPSDWERIILGDTYLFSPRCPACQHLEPRQHHPDNPTKAPRRQLVQHLRYCQQLQLTDVISQTGTAHYFNTMLWISLKSDKQSREDYNRAVILVTKQQSYKCPCFVTGSSICSKADHGKMHLMHLATFQVHTVNE